MSNLGSWVVPFTQTPLGKIVVMILVALIAFGGVAIYINHRNQQAQRQIDRGSARR